MRISGDRLKNTQPQKIKLFRALNDPYPLKARMVKTVGSLQSSSNEGHCNRAKTYSTCQVVFCWLAIWWRQMSSLAGDDGTHSGNLEGAGTPSRVVDRIIGNSCPGGQWHWSPPQGLRPTQALSPWYCDPFWALPFFRFHYPPPEFSIQFQTRANACNSICPG